MPLLPIDLQTLFSQTNTVAREQAVAKEATPQAQSLQASQIVRKTEQRDNAVNETPTQEEGTERIRDRGRRESGGRRERGARRREEPRPTPPRDVVRDPELGRNIDVSG